MSIEKPTDVDEYLEDILNDSGMELDKDLREEMVKELCDQLEVFMTGWMRDHMPKKYQDTFIKLIDGKRPDEEIEQYVTDHVPDTMNVFNKALVEFRRLYLGNRA